MTLSIRRATTGDAHATAEAFIRARGGMPFVPRLHTDAETQEFVLSLVESAETWIAVRGP
jgi:hypothetical protein